MRIGIYFGRDSYICQFSFDFYTFTFDGIPVWLSQAELQCHSLSHSRAQVSPSVV